MGEIRRGAVVLIQRGDPQISGAIVRGLLTGKTGEAVAEDILEGEGRVEIVTTQTDKWRTVAALVHVAVGNTKTPEDYRQMIIKARGDYGPRAHRGRLWIVAEKLTIAWALLVQGMRRAYRAQERVLKP